jgi:hypothetical protein
MDEEIRTLLEENLKILLQKIKTLPDGSEEKRKVVSDYETLHKQWVELMKVDASNKEHADRHELERDKHYLDCQTQDEDRRLKEAQYKSNTRFQIANILVTVATFAGTILFYKNIHTSGLIFEKTGNVNSNHNRNAFSKMLPNLLR